MRSSLILLLLISLLSCRATDSVAPRGADAVEVAIMQGVELDDGVTLSAAGCSRVGSAYEMIDVQVAQADGKTFAASTGTFTSEGADWVIALHGVRIAGAGGGTRSCGNR